MSIEELKHAATQLSDTDRRELIGYLVRLGKGRSAEEWDQIEAKIRDNDPAHWAAGEDLDRVLGLKNSAP
jgi:hypothetical protein